MITSFLQGGLGNQMFQIAAAHALALENKDTAAFDVTNHHLPWQGRSPMNYANNIFKEVNFIQTPVSYTGVYMEPKHSYVPIEYSDNLMLHGFFQSEKYFKHREEEVRKLFTPPEKVYAEIRWKYNLILSGDPISIHVRRGDYVQLKDTHPLCDIQYYKDSLEKMGEYQSIMVFSDDIYWCKNNLDIPNAYVFHIAEEEDWVDLYLMSRCRRNIIANSSFSWWAAWMNNNPNKRVICPRNWFGDKGPQDTQDLIPEGWIQL